MRSFVLWATLLLAGACTTTTPFFESMNAGQSILPHYKTTMPLAFINGHLYVEARVGDRLGVFLIDSGASTIIDSAFLTGITAERVGRYRHRDIHGKIKKMDMVELPDLCLGGVNFKGVHASITSFKDRSIAFEHPFAGIIGANLMKKSVWLLDIGNRQVAIADSRDSFSVPGQAQKLVFGMDKKGTPLLNLRVGHNFICAASFDTGSNGAISLPKKYSRHVPDSANAYTLYVMGSSLFEIQLDTIHSTFIPGLVLGECAALPRPWIELNRRHVRPLIGTDILREYKILIDWSAQAIWLSDYEPDDWKSKPVYGMGLGFDGKNVVVRWVYHGSPTHKAGIRPGDVLLQFGETDCRNLTQGAFAAIRENTFFFKLPAVELSMGRNLETWNCRLEPAQLLKKTMGAWRKGE